MLSKQNIGLPQMTPPAEHGFDEPIEHAAYFRAATAGINAAGLLLNNDPLPAGSNELASFHLQTQAENTGLKAELAATKVNALTDNLTGIYNRRGLEENYEAIRAGITSHSHREPATEGAYLYLLDADHFKNFNDSFGHGAGDEALKTIAARMRESVRPRDICARLGGEEFVLLIPRIEQEQAAAIAERLRQSVEESPASPTISLGYGPVDFSRPLKDNLEKVDTALYSAKQGGRNQVVLVDDTKQQPAD